MDFMDVHAHLHDARISADVSGVVHRARKAGVKSMVTCATMEDNFEATAQLAQDFDEVIPCFGVHPWFLDTLSPDWKQRLAICLGSMPSAVGETGLDFVDKQADRDLQIQVFKAHLDLARDLNRPVNIHVRKAWDALLHILKAHGPLKAGGLIHSFSGSADLVQMLEPHNLYISFSGAVTRPNARKNIAALKAVSPDRILFETDTPDIFPAFDSQKIAGWGAGVALNDRLNQPANLPGIVAMAAKRCHIGFEQLAGYGYSNGLRLFDPVMQHNKR